MDGQAVDERVLIGGSGTHAIRDGVEESFFIVAATKPSQKEASYVVRFVLSCGCEFNEYYCRAGLTLQDLRRRIRTGRDEKGSQIQREIFVVHPVDPT